MSTKRAANAHRGARAVTEERRRGATLKNPRMQAWLTRPTGLATMLRAARGDKSLRDLGGALGWGSSKVSKIETGQQIPTEAEVESWAEVTGAKPADRKKWLKELADTQRMRSTHLRRQDESQAEASTPVGGLEAVSAFIRVVQPDRVPDLLQAPEYAHAYLAQNTSAAKMDDAVAELGRRQDRLHDPAKRFEFLVGEAALRYVPGSLSVMDAQLDRLDSISSRRNIRFGVVPQLRPLERLLGPASFMVFDNTEAVVFGPVEARRHVGPELKSLAETADRIWEQAVEGKDARRLIAAARADIQAA